jgi:response regulator RpfG family c-di-GMP phosphodiesterase
MTIETWIILLSFILSGGVLVYYIRWMLPAQMDTRFRESMKAFSTAVELRFPHHKGMTSRVARLSQETGKRLMLSPAALKRLDTAAHLRDIGLCSIAYRLGNEKHPTRWSEAEQVTYDRHPESGAAMLELIPSLRHIANAVRCHHAPYDGSADRFFPKGEDIPIESRILNVVTSYVWNEKMLGAFLAIDNLDCGLGTLYDPAVTAAFKSVLRSTRADEGKIAAVR